MDNATLYALAADLLLFLHVCIVLFIVMGLVLILIGRKTGWRWVRNPWFRLAHILAIAMVVAQSWIGEICPLTTWEMMLRSKSGGATYTGSFIAHWLEVILYYRAPPWVFTLIYTVFGGLVLVSWFWVRPRSFSRKSSTD